VPDGFIAHAFGGYFLDGQGYFDEFFCGGQGNDE
jgi:hypothetical protein